MSVGTRIKERRESLGMTQTQLAELLGVTKGAIGNYETDSNSPKASILYKVFEVLQCDANYLFQDEIKERREYTASPWEMEHIVKKYRGLDRYGKDMVDMVLEKESARTMQQAVEYHITSNDTEAVRELPLYYMPASAGSGNYLDTTDYEMIQIADISPASKADFAIRIDGDSMEPQFTTGDIVLVKEQDYVEKGELGIFILNGDSLFKQLGDGCLISLNPKYEPCQIGEDDSIYCRGKVLGAVKIAK